MQIMLCLQWTKLILLCVLSSHVLSLTPSNVESRELYMILKSDGTLEYPLNVPNCGSGRKIFLISYSYNQVQCDSACHSVYEEPLLPVDIMLLHELCSLREKCHTLSFTTRSEEQKLRTNSVKINFRCLDQTSTSIDICKPCTVLFNDTLYLTSSGDSARLYTMCECFVNYDLFSINIEDVRLNSIQEKKCTDAELKIDSKEFKCDPKKRNFGSVFKTKVAASASNAFLSLLPKSTTEFPSMVLISVSPRNTSQIVCIPKPSRPETVSLSVASTEQLEATYSVEKVWTTYSMIYQATELSSSSTNCERPFLPAFVVTTVGLIALSGAIYFIWRHRKRKRNYKTGEDGKESESLHTPVNLRRISVTTENGSWTNSNKLHKIFKVSCESISPAKLVILVDSPNISQASSQRSDMLNTHTATCHTTSKSLMYDSVSTASLIGAPSEIKFTEEESNDDIDNGEEPHMYMHKPPPPDETENELNE